MYGIVLDRTDTSLNALNFYKRFKTKGDFNFVFNIRCDKCSQYNFEKQLLSLSMSEIMKVPNFNDIIEKIITSLST